MARRYILLIVLLSAGLLLLALSTYLRDIGRARDRLATGSEVVETPCGPIEYASLGDGPPVLVVHGAGGGFDQGLDFGEPLARDGFRVIAVSRFGYLRTPLPADASPAAQADAHACLLDALGLESVAVIGASAGAPSSLQLALRHPQRVAALALVVPAIYVPRPDNAPSVRSSQATQFLFDTALRWDFLFWAAARLAPNTMTRAILATPPEVVAAADSQEQARVRTMLDHILPVSLRRLGLLNDGAVSSSLPRYELERVRTPTLTLSVEDDLFGTFDGARYTAEHIPNARFVGYPSGGHVWVGRQDALIAELAAFIRR